MKTSLHKNMKKLFVLGMLAIMVIARPQHTFAQQKSVGFNNSTPDVSAVIDAQSGIGISQGILFTRVNLTTLANPFPSPGPATHLFVVNTSSIFGKGIGLYRNSGTAGTPAWKKLLEDGDAWLLFGNRGITSPGTVTYGIKIPSGNFAGTNTASDYVIATDSTERIRFTSTGPIGIGTGTTAPTSNYLLTLRTNATIGNGVDMTLISGSGTGINIATAASAYNGITITHSSNATGTSLYGIGSVLSSTNIVSGYAGYRNGSGKSYGIFGINGTIGTYVPGATNVDTWAAFFKGRTLISGSDPSTPTINATSDLDVRNTTSGAGNPATLSLRQTTSLGTSGDILANLDFGDNYIAGSQARIQVTRPFTAGSTTDLPTSFSFFTNTDASATLKERMRIGSATNNVAEVWVNQASPYVGDVFISRSDLNGDFGVNGYNMGTTSMTLGGGVYGEAAAASTIGVWGTNANTSSTAVAGNSGSTTSSTLATGSGGAFKGVTTGVYAFNTSLGISQAIYSDNGGTICRVNYWNGTTQYKILGTGTVSTTAEDVQGNRVVLHAPETPEIYFQDYGNGTLINGKAHIELDPIITKNITVNEKHPLQVFIQLNGDCKGVFVSNRTATGFDVTELQGGNSNIEFTWTITANRADEILPNGKISKNADVRFELAPANEPVNKIDKKIKINY